MHVVLIPAYEPDRRLVDLVVAVTPTAPVVVVDDGSGARFADVFAAAADAGAVVLAHDHNGGKGAALRTGFAYVASVWPAASIVTADADGQHTPTDIGRVAARLETASVSGPSSLVIVLGARTFEHVVGAEGADAGAARARTVGAGTVPLRSRVGNAIARWSFLAASGQRLQDTQTGLRGYAATTLPWLQTLPGDRFEYEFAMLLRARRDGILLVEEPIETVYLDGNASSHFRPIVDSLRVYGPLLQFTASALLAFVIDTVLLLVFNALTGWLLLSTVAARLLSAGMNFAINRDYVFRSAREVPLRTAALRYASLAGLMLAASFGMLTALTDAGVGVLPAKLVTDLALFLVSYAVQRALVFAPAAPASAESVDARMHAGECSTAR